MRHKLKAMAAALAVVMAVPAAANAQAISSYVFEVMDQLRANVGWRERNAPANEGHLYYHGEIGSLNDNAERQSSVGDLASARYVTFVGFCDRDCSDLDLFVVDHNGNIVAQDVAVDTTPVVTFRPQQGSSYDIRVRMYQCNQEPCFYSVGGFYRM
ncbi:MAG: hypothetical protein AB7J28_05155 [Hyphomonadaceae bacterium]